MSSVTSMMIFLLTGATDVEQFRNLEEVLQYRLQEAHGIGIKKEKCHPPHAVKCAILGHNIASKCLHAANGN